MTGADKNVDSFRHMVKSRSRHGVSLSVRSVAPVLGYLAVRGHAVEQFVGGLGLNGIRFDDPEARIPHETALAMWAEAERLAEDGDIGMHAAESLLPGAFGALEYSVRTSATLGDGLERLARYHRVLHDLAEVRLETDARRAVLSHRLPLPGGAPRQISEFVITAWWLAIRRFTATQEAPLAVRFPHPAPTDLSEHRRLLGSRVVFGHSRSELVLSRKLLDLPMPAADPTLRQIVEAQVTKLLETLPSAESYTAGVRRVLTEMLSDGSSKLEAVATRLALSPRTLHRRLEEEGTNFRDVVRALRRELAEQHLREGRMMIAEIAFLLGYSEASAFHRAFKRWTGLSPQAYRSEASSALREPGS